MQVEEEICGVREQSSGEYSQLESMASLLEKLEMDVRNQLLSSPGNSCLEKAKIQRKLN